MRTLSMVFLFGYWFLVSFCFIVSILCFPCNFSSNTSILLKKKEKKIFFLIIPNNFAVLDVAVAFSNLMRRHIICLLVISSKNVVSTNFWKQDNSVERLWNMKLLQDFLLSTGNVEDLTFPQGMVCYLLRSRKYRVFFKH